MRAGLSLSQGGPLEGSRRWPTPWGKRTNGKIAVLILITFVAYHGLLAFLDPYAQNSDQINIGIMVLKQLQPELFSRDYVFADPKIFAIYTPGFLALIRSLQTVTQSYDVSLAVLLPGIMLVYLGGMFALISTLTGKVWVALLISLLSSPQQWTIGATYWGVAGLGAVMPRALFIMATPWLFLLLFSWIEEPKAWKLGILGLGSGLLSNLHPVSGYHFVQVALSLIFIVHPKGLGLLGALLATGGGAVAGVWPTLLAFIRGVAPRESAGVGFLEYYQLMHERFGTLFPFPPMDFLGYKLGAGAQEVVIWFYLAAVGAWHIGRNIWAQAEAHRRDRRDAVLFLLFLFIQIPVVYLLLGRSKLPLLVVVVAYGILIGLMSKPDRIDWWIAHLLALVITYSFVAAWVLDAAWWSFQWWGITVIAAEQARMATFLYLPLYLMAARGLNLCWEKLPPGMPRVLAVTGLVILTAFPVRRDLFPDYRKVQGRKHEQARRDREELFAWARNSTAIDSLFYSDSLEFRFRAQRSITHCWKDLGLAYLTGRQLLPYYNRFQKYESGYGNVGRLIRIAKEGGVDYIIVENSKNLRPNQPVAYRNRNFTVYQCCLGSLSL